MTFWLGRGLGSRRNGFVARAGYRQAIVVFSSELLFRRRSVPPVGSSELPADQNRKVIGN